MIRVEKIIEQAHKAHLEQQDQQVHKEFKVYLVHPGSQGATGATGGIGPAGVLAINSTNLYEVFGENVTEGSISIARCDLGDVVFDGGFNVVNFSTGAATIDPLRDQPESFGPNINNQYSVILSSNDPTLTYHTKAFCFDNPPLKP